MKWFAQKHPFGADDIVYLAENGNEQAHQALDELIAEYVDRGEPLTQVLGAYDIRSRNPSRRRKPGPQKANHAHFVRDIGIVVMVQQLVQEFRLSPNLKASCDFKIRPCRCG
jgi:hypothetical protein